MGYVGFKEFRYACEAIGMTMHDRELYKVFLFIDKGTKDGAIDLKDVREAFF